MAIEFEKEAVQPSISEQSTRKSGFGRQKLSADDRMFFTEQLTLMLETGANLHSALQTLEKQSPKPAMQAVLADLTQELAEGRTFSYALSHHPEIFSSTYVNLIGAAETGGFMSEILAQLLEMDEKRERLRASLFSAFSYPAFLTFFSVAVVIFILAVVFPKFGQMFANIQDQLPASTLILMQLSDWMRAYWPQMLVAIAGSALGVRYWLASSTGNAQMDRLKLSPVFRNVFVPLYVVQSMRVMSLSLGNGVSVVDTLEACKDVVKNSRFRKLIRGVEESVQQGNGIAAGFDEGTFLPPIVTQLVRTGEAAGNLPRVMARLADYYERDLNKRLTAFAKMAEPIMLLVMGLVVGLVVSSLILPIFKLSKAVA